MKKSPNEIKEAIKKHYGQAIKHKAGSCCQPVQVETERPESGWTSHAAGYGEKDFSELPNGVTSFGCGNPIAFSNVSKGETVLDLGSGAGMDLILAAKKVGPTGKVIGLDMTPEMIDACRANLSKAGISNAEVRLGEMENMPVDDGEVDWIISNCVINLSPDKRKVFAEAFRVLKPGGQLMISDTVTINLPDEYREDIKAWVGCIAGAIEQDEYIQLVKEAGFRQARFLSRHVYEKSALCCSTSDCDCGSCSGEKSGEPDAMDKYAGKIASVLLYARKPD